MAGKGLIANLRPWQKGQTGNPGGKRKEKPFRDALRFEVDQCDGDVTKLQRVAAQLVKNAIEGDTNAILAIRDSLDGKPVQALANDEENPLFTPTMTDGQIDERLKELLTATEGGTAGVVDGKEPPSQLH